MSRQTFDQKTFDPNWVTIKGSFLPDTANPPTKGTSRGWDVVRTSTGLFTVTFSDPFQGHRDARASLRLATGDDKIAQVGAIVTAARTMQIRIWDISSAAVADVAANADNVISFAIDVSNSLFR